VAIDIEVDALEYLVGAVPLADVANLDKGHG
jgi:hypothetical protein